MAGSGELSRVGNTRALNAALISGVTGGVVNAPGDQVGALSASLGTGAQTSLACAATGGGAVLTKAIPDKAILAVCDAAGAVDQMETVSVNGAVAAAGTAVTFQSQTIRVSHAAGSLLFLIAFKPYLALVLSSGAPTDNGLGTEYSQTGYARNLIPWTAPTTGVDPPVAANQNSTTFGPLSGANGTDVVAYASLRDALSGGAAANQYCWWTFATTRTPNAGDSLNIAAGALTAQVFH